MRFLFRILLLLLMAASVCLVQACPAQAQAAAAQLMPGMAEQLLALANRSRAEAGVGRLVWDEQLAAAARAHTLRMAAEGPIAHRYDGEPTLADRAGRAGAHFDSIEENVAVGSGPAAIHEGWMHSPGHRANLLNADVNRVGIAVVFSNGVYYATADYDRSVASLSREQVEAHVAGLLMTAGLKIIPDHGAARAACLLDHGMPPGAGAAQPLFVMRWQDADLTRLPETLERQLRMRDYRRAEVGSCPARNADPGFTVYRVAVLLYSGGAADWPKSYYQPND